VCFLHPSAAEKLLVLSGMASTLLILVGGFTSFISAIRFNPATNGLSYVTQTAVGVSPSWLTLHPNDSSVVYASEDQYSTSGSIYALKLDASTGALTQRSKISTQTANGNGGSVSIDVSTDGKWIGAANYNSGSAFFVQLGADKLSFSGSGQLVKFNGSGPLQNQRGAHAHQVRNSFRCQIVR
jgi:6-phosphogluconolactonase (cycloisomerase 2 family)